MQKEIATIIFNDAETSDESVAIVKVLDNKIGLTLSQRANGDLETVLPVDIASQLLQALQTAITSIENEQAARH